MRHSEIRGGAWVIQSGSGRRNHARVVEAKVGIGVAKTQVGYGTQVSKGSSAVPYGHRWRKGRGAVDRGSGRAKAAKGPDLPQENGQRRRKRVSEAERLCGAWVSGDSGAAEAAGIAKIEGGFGKRLRRVMSRDVRNARCPRKGWEPLRPLRAALLTTDNRAWPERTDNCVRHSGTPAGGVDHPARDCRCRGRGVCGRRPQATALPCPVAVYRCPRGEDPADSGSGRRRSRLWCGLSPCWRLWRSKRL